MFFVIERTIPNGFERFCTIPKGSNDFFLGFSLIFSQKKRLKNPYNYFDAHNRLPFVPMVSFNKYRCACNKSLKIPMFALRSRKATNWCAITFSFGPEKKNWVFSLKLIWLFSPKHSLACKKMFIVVLKGSILFQKVLIIFLRFFEFFKNKIEKSVEII